MSKPLTAHYPGKLWSLGLRVLATIGVVLMITTMASGDGGAPGAPGAAECQDCEALQGCFRLFDPEGGNRERKADVECVLCGSAGTLSTSDPIPKPPPGVDSLAYCLAKFLKGTGLVYMKMPDVWPDEPVMHWAGGTSQYIQVGSDAWLNGDTNGADWWVDGRRLFGTDRSVWEFERIGETNYYIPTRVYFSDELYWDGSGWAPDRPVDIEWGYLDDDPDPNTSELLDWDLVEDPDISNFRIATISSSNIRYEFEYGAGSNPSGTLSENHSDEIRTVKMYWYTDLYAQTTSAYYSSTSGCSKGAFDGRRSTLTFARVVSSNLVTVAKEHYTWHTGGGSHIEGKPACIYRGEASVIKEAYSPGSDPCTDFPSALASECREYHSDTGQLKQVTQGQACCGG